MPPKWFGWRFCTKNGIYDAKKILFSSFNSFASCNHCIRRETNQRRTCHILYWKKHTFLNLSKTACLAQEQHKIVFHVYRHNEEDRIEHPEIKDYPELDNQLKSTINGKFLQDIAIFGEPCRLYVSVWDGGMVLGGESIAYEYNPKNIQPYDPNADLDKMKKEFKNIYYTIELSDGWFVSYQYWP